MESSTYVDAKFIAASRNCVNIVGHQDTKHGSRELMVGKEKKTFCNAYWNIPCDVHVKGYAASSHFELGGTIGMPCTIMADPEGKEIKSVPHKNGAMSTGELMKMIDAAVAAVPGEHIGYADWSSAQKLFSDGDAAFEKEDYRKAIDSWTKLQKMKQKALKEMGDEAMKRAEERGNAQLDEAQKKIDTDKEEAKKLLKKIVDGFKPLECSKKAAEALKGLEDKK